MQGTTEAFGGWWSGAWVRRSDEGGVAPSEVILEVTLVVGNAHPRQRGPGHSVVSIAPERARAQYREVLALEIETREQVNRTLAG